MQKEDVLTHIPFSDEDVVCSNFLCLLPGSVLFGGNLHVCETLTDKVDQCHPLTQLYSFVVAALTAVFAIKQSSLE